MAFGHCEIFRLRGKWNEINPPIRRRAGFHPCRGFHRRRRFIPPVRVDLAEKTTVSIKTVVFSWRTRRDSNPWPSESESDTLSGWATGTIINKWKMSCTHRSTPASQRHSGRWLLPGRPAAHWLFCLMLLPSRPDMVHRRQLHGTRQSTLLIDTGPHRRMPHDGNYTLL